MHLNEENRKKIKKEIERIYFRKILKNLVAGWMKISDKIKLN